MKNIINIILLLCISMIGHAQFLGGNGAGDAHLRKTNSSCSFNFSSPFLGGNADGAANLRWVHNTCTYPSTNPFLGGAADGHANRRLINSVCTYPNNNPFLGGAADGHSNSRLSNLVCTITSTNPFAGGIADGQASATLVNSVCTITSTNPFAGGIADGHANSRLNNLVCSVTGTNPFAGGFADGHGNSRITNVTCTITPSNPFKGGFADGHANSRRTNTTCTSTVTNPFRGGREDVYVKKFFIACGASSLPVELLSFNATPVEKRVDITWSTASETNCDFFTVERSQHGEKFEQVATLKAAGNSSIVLRYKTTDENPYTGTSYYRLKQTDYNGEYNYSSVVKVNISQRGDYRIYPNPALNENVLIEITGNKNDNVAIDVYDAGGNSVLSKTTSLMRDGKSVLPLISAGSLKPGIYMVRLVIDQLLYNCKLVIN